MSFGLPIQDALGALRKVAGGLVALPEGASGVGPDFFKKVNFLYLDSTDEGFSTSVSGAGSAVTRPRPGERRLVTDGSSGGDAEIYGELRTLGKDGDNGVDWDNQLVAVFFNFSVAGYTPNGGYRLHLKETITARPMSSKGIGFRVVDTATTHTLYGETYNTAAASDNLGETLSNGKFHKAAVIHVPGDGVYFYLDGKLVGVEKTQVPSGQSSSIGLLLDAYNGTDTVAVQMDVGPIIIITSR